MSASTTQWSRAVGGRHTPAGSPTRALTAGESAWLAALSCGLLLFAAVMLLGPPLGRALFAAPSTTDVWPRFVVEHVPKPEPTEHARYVIALLGPLLAAGGALALSGRRVDGRLADLLTRLSRAALLAFVGVCLVGQRLHVYPDAVTFEGPRHTVYFTVATLLAATALALVGAALLQSREATARLAALLQDTAAKRRTAIGVASLFLATWFLSSFNTDASIVTANEATGINIPFWIDEAFAVLNGQAPLVDFHAQYGQVWAYVGAAGMALLGTNLAAYSATMIAGTAGALAAVFATFRQLTASSLAALGLFLPFVATSFYMAIGPPANRYGPANLYSLFPIRYGGPFVLLWLVVRHVGRGRGSVTALFALAAVVAVNNPEFGIPAAAATSAALLWGSPSRSRSALVRLATSAAAGGLAGVGAFAALTLAVSGSLPRFGMLSTFPRIFAVDGFGLLPMPAVGLHLIVYLTFSAALVVATVRVVTGDEDRAMTAALAWAAIFGLGAGGYYVGRSHPHVLIGLFSAWTLALSLLLVVVVRSLVRGPTRRPGIVELLVLAGFGLAICSLPQVPKPWSQIERLQRRPPHGLLADDLRTVRHVTHRGEPVAILLLQGHRIAYELGLRDVTPYANMELMVTTGQWAETVAALRAARGRVIVLPRLHLMQEQVDWLRERGYRAFYEDGADIAMRGPAPARRSARGLSPRSARP